MPRNGSGSYNAPASSWNPAVSGTAINATDWNALLADMASALTQSVAKDGQTAMTGALALAGNPASALQAAPKQYVDQGFLMNQVFG